MPIEREQLFGGWRLVRWSIEYGAQRAAETPFGEDAEGLLLYGADGWMTATMHERCRSAWTHASARLASVESRAAAATEYLSYGGRWRVEGNTVFHEIRFSVNPILVGTTQAREVEWVGGALHLVARESEGRRERLHRIVWRRDLDR